MDQTNDIAYWPVLRLATEHFLQDNIKVYVFHYGKSCLICTEDNRLYACGNNHYGRLGLGNSTDSVEPPKEITQLSGKKIIQIIEGSNTMMCLTETGELYSWGRNINGRLGLGELPYGCNQLYPRKINFNAKVNIIKVECGRDHTLALDNNANIWSWGGNDFGQLGDGSLCTSSDPIQIDLLGNVEDIAATFDTSMALVVNDQQQTQIYVWGKMLNSQRFNTPRRLELNHLPEAHFTSITAAASNTFLLLDQNGKIYQLNCLFDIIEPIGLNDETIVSAIFGDCKNFVAFLLDNNGCFHVWYPNKNVRKNLRSLANSQHSASNIIKTSITSLADVQFLYCRPVMLMLTKLNISPTIGSSLNDETTSDCKLIYCLTERCAKYIYISRSFVETKSKYFKQILSDQTCRDIKVDGSDFMTFPVHFAYLRYLYTKKLDETDELILNRLREIASEKSLRRKCQQRINELFETEQIVAEPVDEIDSSTKSTVRKMQNVEKEKTNPSSADVRKSLVTTESLFWSSFKMLNIYNFLTFFEIAYVVKDLIMKKRIIDFVKKNRRQVFESSTYFFYPNQWVKKRMTFELIRDDLLTK